MENTFGASVTQVHNMNLSHSPSSPPVAMELQYYESILKSASMMPTHIDGNFEFNFDLVRAKERIIQQQNYIRSLQIMQMVLHQQQAQTNIK